MNISYKKRTLSLILLVLLFSCVSKKDIVYFQYDEIDQSKVSNSYKTIIKPDDLLQINISALDQEATKPFNLGANSITGNQQSYLVDNNGEIDFPVIGSIKIGGLSRSEVIRLLKNKLSPDYVKNPNINIRITNYAVSILGDVARPGKFTIPNERITILEAIALAGDTNISAKRDNIIVHREEGGKKIQYKVNLLSNKINISPVYYLQQNDVIYVEPNYAKSQSASDNHNTGLFISIGSVLLALIAILTR
jgi:polysaccharide export outer membrane protein